MLLVGTWFFPFLRQVTFDGEVEYQTEMATYVLFMVHTDDDDDNDDDFFNLL